MSSINAKMNTNITTTIKQATTEQSSPIATSVPKVSQRATQVEYTSDSSKDFINEMTDEHGNPTEQAFQIAVNKLNEFMEHTQRNSKFIYHKDLDRYYVEVVDAKTQEVVKEVPPKELLDAYYEMQKLVGKMFDTQA